MSRYIPANSDRPQVDPGDLTPADRWRLRRAAKAATRAEHQRARSYGLQARQRQRLSRGAGGATPSTGGTPAADARGSAGARRSDRSHRRASSDSRTEP